MCCSVYAEQDSDWSEAVIEGQYDALDLDELYEAAGEEGAELLDGIGVLDGDFSGGLGSIFSAVMGKLGDIVKKAAGSGAVILAIGIICSMVASVYDESGKSVPSYVNLVGVLAISAVVLGSSSSFLNLGVESITKLDDFSKTLLPALSTLAASSGAITSASVKYMATIMFFDILLTITKQVIMPVIYAYIAVSIASAAFGGQTLAGVAKVFKWMANIMITAIMIAFVTYISVSGIVSSSADAATTRVAKTVISTAVPVVGGIISDAAASIVAGTAMVKGAVGVFGLLVVLAICIVPFLRLGASYLIYKLAAALTEGIADKPMSELVGSFGSAFGMVMGLVGAGAMIMFFAVISLMKAVT